MKRAVFGGVALVIAGLIGFGVSEVIRSDGGSDDCVEIVAASEAAKGAAFDAKSKADSLPVVPGQWGAGDANYQARSEAEATVRAEGAKWATVIEQNPKCFSPEVRATASLRLRDYDAGRS